MTVLEASEKLFKWFSENDYFMLSRDLKNVNPITETEVEDRVAFTLALEELEKNELLASKKIEDDDCWVLKKPFTSYEQNVIVQPPIAMALSQAVNAACEEFGDDTDLCDPSNIQEKDIRSLILIYNHKMYPQIEED